MPTLGTVYCIARRFSSSFAKRMKNCAKNSSIRIKFLTCAFKSHPSYFHYNSRRHRAALQFCPSEHAVNNTSIKCLTQFQIANWSTSAKNGTRNNSLLMSVKKWRLHYRPSINFSQHVWPGKRGGRRSSF